MLLQDSAHRPVLVRRDAHAPVQHVHLVADYVQHLAFQAKPLGRLCAGDLAGGAAAVRLRAAADAQHAA
jgi:hypothetical protein